MTNQHPILFPPPDKFNQWEDNILNERENVGVVLIEAWQAGHKAGADQELEACCEWLDDRTVLNGSTALRAARRPKPFTLPLTLKDQALALLEIQHGIDVEDLAFIRRALEALPND